MFLELSPPCRTTRHLIAGNFRKHPWPFGAFCQQVLSCHWLPSPQCDRPWRAKGRREETSFKWFLSWNHLLDQATPQLLWMDLKNIYIYYSIHTAGRLIRLLGLKFFDVDVKALSPRSRIPWRDAGYASAPQRILNRSPVAESTRGTAGEPNAVRSLREWTDLHWFEGFGRASIHFIYIYIIYTDTYINNIYAIYIYLSSYIYILISHWQLGFHWIDISRHFSPKLNLLRAHLKYPTGWQIIAMPPRDSEAWHELTALSFWEPCPRRLQLRSAPKIAWNGR
jgi:hypothetical protein